MFWLCRTEMSARAWLARRETAGYPSDATDNAVQANIVAAGY